VRAGMQRRRSKGVCRSGGHRGHTTPAATTTCRSRRGSSAARADHGIGASHALWVASERERVNRWAHTGGCVGVGVACGWQRLRPLLPGLVRAEPVRPRRAHAAGRARGVRRRARVAARRQAHEPEHEGTTRPSLFGARLWLGSAPYGLHPPPRVRTLHRCRDACAQYNHLTCEVLRAPGEVVQPG
jgi:hypothetical protein